MPEPIDHELPERLTRFEADALTDAEIAGLGRELLDDPAKRAALIGHFEFGQKLRTALRQKQCDERIVRLVPGGKVAGSESRRRAWPKVVLASAAALLVMGTAWVGFFPTDSTSSPGIPLDAPRLVFAQGVTWSGPDPGPLGSSFADGPWELQSGIVRLQFADGASVTIEGPAVFNTNGSKVIELGSGQLAANNEVGKGFTVVTEGSRFETEGTSFGVQARPGRKAEVCVFRGEVGIETEHRPSTMLMAGSFAPVGAGVGSKIMSASQRLPFQSALLVTCGIESLDGTALLFPSDIEHGLMGHEADGKAFLIPERIVRIDAAIPVSLVGAGSLSDGALESVRRWQASGPVRSFLLHASPSTRIEKRGSQSFSGCITFEHTIEAVIVSSKLLDASERMFGETVGQESGRGRGLERLHGWEARARGRAVSDQVRVSEDRKTLAFELLVGEKADQIRVLTAGE